MGYCDEHEHTYLDFCGYCDGEPFLDDITDHACENCYAYVDQWVIIKSSTICLDCLELEEAGV